MAQKIYYQKFSTFCGRPYSIVVKINYPGNTEYKGSISISADMQYNPLQDYLETLETPDNLRHYERDLPKIEEWLIKDGFAKIIEPVFDYFGETDKIKKLTFKAKSEFLKAVEEWREYTG